MAAAQKNGDKESHREQVTKREKNYVLVCETVKLTWRLRRQEKVREV